MERFTILFDENFSSVFDYQIRNRDYQNRSEAVLDFLRSKPAKMGSFADVMIDESGVCQFQLNLVPVIMVDNHHLHDHHHQYCQHIN